ncbi:pilus assembly protein TadG-related protein [Sphingomonas swuensis]|uniref:pilus assembly protein TadG-related protein n=1 Tax=Sphingomonas swuensis TaxID=977800 RepID=UPI0031E1D40E
MAPIVALSLTGLIAVGGIAFDYARLAAMDTELQNAADQAALAAATQLDRVAEDEDTGELGARARATNAVTDPTMENRLARNFTRFANDDDDDGADISVTLTFCSDFDDSEGALDDACTEAEGDSDARFVVVTTSLRTANYVFTPIVAAFSGSSAAQAVAGVEASICNVAPLLVCTDSDFPTDDDRGRGLRMKVFSGDSWAPGNYGLLDFGSGNTGVVNALLGFGLNGCQATDDNETEPGNKNVTDAVNTRLDVYAGSPSTKDASACKVATGEGCPAPNARKDMIIDISAKKTTKFETATATPTAEEIASATSSAPSCPSDPKTDGYAFQEAPSQATGFARDTCHYSDNCAGGNFGDKAWDRASYLAENHPGVTAAEIAAALDNGSTAATLTRYDIYQWELANPGARMATKRSVNLVGPPDPPKGKKTTYSWTVKTQCAYPSVKYGSTAYPEQKDRRILPIVAADCSKLKGKGAAYEDYTILRVFDVFLTEPSLQRGPSSSPTTDEKEIYGEVIGPATTSESGSGFQYYSRSKPYLIR